jgi:hypothetical protein
MTDKQLDAIAEFIGRVMAAILLAAAGMTISALVVVICWNRVAPDLFGLREITLADALYMCGFVAGISMFRLCK